MSVTVTKLSNTTPIASQVDEAARLIGSNFTAAENNLLAAYSLKEGATATDINNLATALGVKNSPGTSIRSLQIIAEQRFQNSSQVLTLFSNILSKVDELKQRLIAKFAN